MAWMDDDCKQLKCELNASRKEYQEAIKLDFENNSRLTLRDSYFKNRRNYRKLCWKKLLEHSLYNLRSEDLKEFWNKHESKG